MNSTKKLGKKASKKATSAMTLENQIVSKPFSDSMAEVNFFEIRLLCRQKENEKGQQQTTPAPGRSQIQTPEATRGFPHNPLRRLKKPRVTVTTCLKTRVTVTTCLENCLTTCLKKTFFGMEIPRVCAICQKKIPAVRCDMKINKEK